MLNGVANFMDPSTAGGIDVFAKWMSVIGAYWQNKGLASLWGLITGALASLLEAILLLVGYLLFPITYALFSLLYALYGSILSVVGPFVLALYPATGIGALARTYIVNLMIFNAWGLLYSIFGALMAAIGMNSVNGVLNQQSFLGGFAGVSNALLLGLASIFLSLLIVLIPLLANRIVEGDVGHSMTTVIRTTMIAAKGIGGLFTGGKP